MTSFSRKLTLSLAFAAACISSSYATTYTEDFEASFPTWESGWLGANSNLQNYYGVGAGRGNNPDGLWIQDGLSLVNETRITFAAAFGQTLTSLSLDIASYHDVQLEIFDSSGVTLGSWNVAPTYGAGMDPGIYLGFGVGSISGIGGFRLLASDIEGNTSIDNVVAISGGPVVPSGPSVPDHASTLVLSGLCLSALLALRRRMSN